MVTRSILAEDTHAMKAQGMPVFAVVNGNNFKSGLVARRFPFVRIVLALRVASSFGSRRQSRSGAGAWRAGVAEWPKASD